MFTPSHPLSVVSLWENIFGKTYYGFTNGLHRVHIHGPAVVHDDTFVGMKFLIFRSSVGKGCVIEPGVILMGVSVAE